MRARKVHSHRLRRLACRAVLIAAALLCLQSAPSSGATFSNDPEPAPIVERKLEVADFTLKTTDGRAFNLREYAQDKPLVIVAYVAGWCPNSNRNGHILKRLYDKYHQRGLGVVVVMEYSDPGEISIHINRIGIDYPVVVETSRQGQRKDSQHYKYRRQADDRRKWGTPFYVLIDSRDIERAAASPVLARRVWTVSGEIVESEAEAFIENHLAAK
ncbi:MAG TPA: redoxin family protein [Blastocatellia bacterium]|nr:redoxin family protein [Blastocatellia bacterium]